MIVLHPRAEGSPGSGSPRAMPRWIPPAYSRASAAGVGGRLRQPSSCVQPPDAADSGRSASPLIGPSKERYQRKRPFLRARGLSVCRITPEFSRGGSYPSGHSTVGWTYALILTELAPDRASGSCWREDVSLGKAAWSASTLRVRCRGRAGSRPRDLSQRSIPIQRFRADLEAAKCELAEPAMQAPAPDSAQCAIEKDAFVDASMVTPEVQLDCC